MGLSQVLGAAREEPGEAETGWVSFHLLPSPTPSCRYSSQKAQGVRLQGGEVRAGQGRAGRCSSLGSDVGQQQDFLARAGDCNSNPHSSFL